MPQEFWNNDVVPVIQNADRVQNAEGSKGITGQGLAAQPEKPGFTDSQMGDDAGCPSVGRRKEEKLEGSIASSDRGEGPGHSLKGKSSGPGIYNAWDSWRWAALRWWCS